jgi:putative transposase
MKNTNIYAGYRYPSQIISHAVWLYHRFTFRFRDTEELLAARGITFGGQSFRMVTKLTFWFRNVKTRKQRADSSESYSKASKPRQSG